MSQQRALLESLLSPARIRRLMDAELLTPNDAYTGLDLVGDVQNGIWGELKTEAPKVDVCRRALQRTYLDVMKRELSPKEETAKAPNIPFPFDGEAPAGRNTDLRAIARAALTDLSTRLDAAIPRTRDPITLAHLIDCRREIDSALKAKNSQ